MTRVVTPVQAVEVDEICDECKKGRYRLRAKLAASLTSENKLAHFCNECGERKDFEERLPYMAYQPIPVVPLDLGPQIKLC